MPSETTFKINIILRSKATLVVRSIFAAFIVSALFLLGKDALAILFTPDDRVFVAANARGFDVWPSVSSYERDTGNNWLEQPPGTTDFLATFHGVRRQRALGGIFWHALLLVLSVIGLWSLRRVEDPPLIQHTVS